MNKILILVALSFINCKYVTAQPCKYDVALSAGFYKAPSYQHAVDKTFLAADFDYHLSNRWLVSTGFMSGQFAYFDDWWSNVFSYEDYTNARGYESHIYFTASYSVIRTNKFSLQVGSGIGLFTQRIKFPFQALTSYGTGIPAGSIFTAEESFSIAEVLFKIEGFYMLGTRIGMGVRAGTYIQANRPLSGTYIGPQLRVRL